MHMERVKQNCTKKKLEYKWVVIATCFLMVFVTLGFCSSSKSLYLSAITDALGIKRSVFSISDSFRYITTAIVNIFFGVLVSKYGTRKMIGAGFASLVAFALISASGTSVYAFYLAGCFLGMGLSWTSTTMVGHVVNLWCKEKKGTIMGFVLAANGFGGALAIQIISPLINAPEDAFGYQNAYLVTAVILAVVGVVVVGLFREKPTENKELKLARHNDASTTISKKELSNPVFLIVAGCVFSTGMILQGINGIAVSHMKDVGLDPAYIAAVFSVHSLLLAACKFTSGLVHDKIGIRKTMLICNLAAVIAPVLLICITPNAIGKGLAVVFCVAFAMALPLETVMLPLIVLDLFGEKDYVKLLGVFVSINTAGYALGGPLTNLCYDLFGNYQIVLGIMATIMIVITITIRKIFLDKPNSHT